MAWLRLDDGFTSNSKIVQLTDGEFRVWLRLLCHCARSRDPSVDGAALREVSGLNRKRIETFAELGLIDPVGDSYEVHDWAIYLPSEQQKADRQARWRARKRAAKVDATVDDAVDDEVDAAVDASASRAGAGTRGSPSRPVPEDQEQRASERELQDAHRSPAEEHAREDDPEPLPDPNGTGPMAEAVHSELGRLRPRGATA